MKCIAPLMIEHRLIERMVALLKKELDSIEAGNSPDKQFISSGVDFFRTYADRTHHGKEEDILFKSLEKKKISPEHKRIMNELLEEHKIARINVSGLFDANQSDDAKLIMKYLKVLIGLYPPHIAKEDKDFFIQILVYYSEKEQAEMLDEFFDFDAKMIHEKYKKTVAGFEDILK